MLEGDERAELRGKVAESDLNGDGVIDIDEIVMHLSSPGSGVSSTASSSSGSTSSERSSSGSNREQTSNVGNRSTGKSRGAATSGGSARVITNDRWKTYRFKPASERLPSGLPSFFSRDANGDGQIAMSEYSRRWTDRSVQEFRRYDLDNDGMITPKECQERQ